MNVQPPLKALAEERLRWPLQVTMNEFVGLTAVRENELPSRRADLKRSAHEFIQG